MTKVAIRRTAFAVALAVALAAMAVWADTAHAAEGGLTAGDASLAPQSSATNTTMYYAQELTSGKAVINAFDYDENDNFETYWYKFKTSNRRSVYEVKADSIDGKELWVWYCDSNGKALGWENRGNFYLTYGSHDSWPVDNTRSMTKSDLDRSAWYYFTISHGKAARYDQYKIVMTEHPVMAQVTGLKATKKTKSSLALKWAKQANATKYQVQYKKKGGSWASKTVTGNTATLSKLSKNTSYQVRVRAYCKNGYNNATDKFANWGAWSATKAVKTAK